MQSRIRKVCVIVASITLSVAALSVAAPAAGADQLDASQTTASSHAPVSPNLVGIDECLEGFLLPSDIIEGWGRGDITYQLRCGDPTKGLLHIESDHGPLEGATGDVFSACLGKILQFGEDFGKAKPVNSLLYQLSYSSGNGGKATAIVDTSTGDVLTAYTTGTSREWSDCVAG